MNKTSWIFVITTVVIVAIISFFFIRPQITGSWKIHKDTEAAKQELDDISKRKETLTKLQQNGDLASIYKIASQYIPEEADSGTLVIELSAIASSSNMKVEQVSLETKDSSSSSKDDGTSSETSDKKTSTTTTNSDSKPAFQEIPFTMKMSGTFTDFQKFLQNVEASSRLMAINAMTLTQQEGVLTAELEGKTYWKKGTSIEKTLSNVKISQDTIDMFKNLKTYGTPINLPTESGFGRADPFANF